MLVYEAYHASMFRPRPINWCSLVATLEAAGVDVAKLCRVDRKTVWRWKQGDSKPGADNAVELWERNRRQLENIGNTSV